MFLLHVDAYFVEVAVELAVTEVAFYGHGVEVCGGDEGVWVVVGTFWHFSVRAWMLW